jgi:eukaryotic-like serine/threonine-protein kinase
MNCPACAATNPDDAAFCGSCGTPLAPEAPCPRCSRNNPLDLKFCRGCGYRLGGGEAAAEPSRHPSLPTGIASGRYKVSRFLGEGGRKRVFLARDSSLDRDVALALIKTEGLDEAGLQRVRFEAQAMARLGDHQNIVTVFDIGEQDGATFLVCQYMSGGSVEDLIAASEGKGIGVEETVRLGGHVAHALDHAHSRGVVHRDVKPGNVWLGEDGNARLGDFGLAVALDRSRLTAEGMMLGTVAYMAPEQALGRTPDARSDLYSLGSMLYEMLTGRPPFLGDEAVAIISQHIGTAPVAPSWHNPDVPPALERLVMALLAKDPDKRPSTAAEVRDALAAIATATSMAGPAAAGVAEANPLDRLAGGVFVGREREMDDLRAGLDDALSGRGRLLLLMGEPGIGKTRMADELATYARLRGAQVLVGRCYEGEGAPAYWPWVQVIRAFVHDRDRDALSSVMGPGAAEIAQIVSDVRERIPDLLEPPSLDPEQARFRLFDSIATFLKNASRAQPIVVVLDDLHWADKPTLLLLQFLAREVRSSRLLVLGTYRDVELRRQHPLAQTLAELAREQVSTRIVLRGLTVHDVWRFIEMTCGVEPPANLVRAVYRETEGNPFFVAEIVRLLASEGKFSESGEGSWSISIPQSVREVIGRRLDQLSEGANSVLSIAAVAGREFALGVVQAVSDLDLDAVSDAIDEARAARVITEAGRSVDRYIFSHALIRETLYEEIPTARRIMLHRRLGETLEPLYEGGGESHLAELAYHFLEAAPGGDVRKAFDYAERAAARAIQLLAYEEAARHYERAIESLPLLEKPDEQLHCRLLLRLGDAQRRSGDVDAARAAFFAAAERARKIGDGASLAEAAIGLQAGAAFGQVDEKRVVILEQALDAVGDGDLALRSRLLGHLARALYFSENFEPVRALGEETVTVAEAAGDPVALAEALSTRAYVLWGIEPPESRETAGTRIADIGRRVGDVELELDGVMWRMIGLADMGDFARTNATVEEYSRIAETSHIPRYRLYALSRQAMIASVFGRFEDAERLSDEAFRIGVQAQEPDAIQVRTGQRFTNSIFTGDREGIEWAQNSLKTYAAMYSARQPWTRILLSMGAHALGDEQTARREYDRAFEEGLTTLPAQGVSSGMMLSWATVLCDIFGDVEAAAAIEPLIRPFEKRIVMGAGAVFCFGIGSRYLAILAKLQGRLEEADAYFRDAVERCRFMGARPWLAETLHDYAGLLVERRAAGDLEQALRMLDEVLGIATELGMAPLAERALARKLEAQGIALPADVRSSIDVVASSLERERPDLRTHAAPDGTVTLLFTDIEGSTALNEQVGDRRWIELLRMHNAIVREHVATHGGFEVKSSGDGFMVAFSSARRGLACAVAIQRGLAEHAGKNPDDAVRVRIGLHTGEAIAEAGDFYGRHVNLAARVGAAANGGEILVSGLLHELIASSKEFEFEEGREVQLKGLAGVHRVYPVKW